MGKKRYMYLVKDTVAGDFGPIFESVNDQVAIRAYRNLLKDVEPSLKADYQLFQVGEVVIDEDGSKVCVVGQESRLVNTLEVVK